MSIIIISVILALLCLLITYLLIVSWFQTCEKHDIYGQDINKLTHPDIPEMGGVPVMAAYLLILGAGMAALKLAGFLEGFTVWQLASVIFAILGVALVGIVDDLYDLKQRWKAVLPIFFVIPFAWLYNIHIDVFPISLTLALWMEILLVSFMVDAAANASNMLEGYNGMGVGLAILMDVPIIFLSVVFWNELCLLISIVFLGACITFFYFNRYPARLFPGDVMTLPQGAILAMVPIIGNFEEIGAILFIPMIVNGIMTVLQLRTKYAKFGYRNRFGIIRFSRAVIALPHYLANRYQLDERQISWSIHLLQFGVSMATMIFVIFLGGL